MKKISIILSTVVAASLLALASCSNVTELNGNQYDSYKAEQAAASKAADAANALAIEYRISSGAGITLKNDDGKTYASVKYELTTKVPGEFTLPLANPAAAEIAKETGTITIGVGNLSAVYKNKKVDQYATSVTFTITDSSTAKDLTFGEAGEGKGKKFTATISS